MTEAELQKAVVDTAHLFGWRCAHFRPALTQSGRWVTPVAADGKGFPDLVLVSSTTVAFIELKGTRGRESDEQKEWLSALTRVAGSAANGRVPLHVDVWKPADWTSGAIEEFLRVNA